MLSATSLSAKSVQSLQNRGLSEQQMNDFSALLDKANEQLDQQSSAKQVLASMSSAEMNLLQKATSLANPITISTLSNEGARNLLAQPDGKGLVDNNNDGIVEIGAGRTIRFPPVNAPASVHKAWEQASENMSEGDKLIMQLHMHHLVYGTHIDGLSTKQALPPEEQWSTAGWQKLLENARAALEFSVDREGWNHMNSVKRDLYNRLEEMFSNMNVT